MKDLFKFFKELLKKQPRGAVAIEYVLIAATIVLGSFSYLKNVENGVRNRLVGIAGSLVGFDNDANGGDISGDGNGENEIGGNETPPPSDVCEENCELQGKVCRGGKCVGCTFDTDCGGKKCDTTTGTCVQCKADSDCGSGEICKGGSCIADPNSCNPPCVQGQICKKDGGSPQCVVDEKCEGDGNSCKATQTCFEGFCKDMPAACADCIPEKERCENGRCVLRGNGACQSVNCGNGEYCLDGVCRKGSSCSSSTDCSNGQVCGGGICAPATCTPELCKGTFVGSVCVNDKCVIGNDTNCAPDVWDPITQECTKTCTSADSMKEGPCGSGKFCQNGKCVPTSECNGNNQWDSATGTCKPANCSGSWGEKSTCPDGFFCAGGSCEDVTSKCTGIGGTWGNNKCTVYCTNTDLSKGTCPEGTFCLSGKCVDIDTECTGKGGTWNGGKCTLSCTYHDLSRGECPEGTFCLSGTCVDIDTECTGKAGTWNGGKCTLYCTNTDLSKGTCPEGKFCLFGTCVDIDTECTGKGGTWDGTRCEMSCQGTWGKPIWNAPGFMCIDGSWVESELCASLGGVILGQSTAYYCHRYCTGTKWGEKGNCPDGQFCDNGLCMTGDICRGYWDGTKCVKRCTDTNFNGSECPDGQFCLSGSCVDIDTECTGKGGTWDGTRCNLSCTYHDLSQGECPEGTFCWKGECKDQSFCSGSSTGLSGASWDASKNACVDTCGEGWGEPIGISGFVCIDGYAVHPDACASLGGLPVNHGSNFGLYCHMYCTGSKWGERGNCPVGQFCDNGLCNIPWECTQEGGTWDGTKCNRSCTYHDLSQGECPEGTFCWKGECKDQSFCSGSSTGLWGSSWDASKNACVDTCAEGWGEPIGFTGFVCIDGYALHGDGCASIGGVLVEEVHSGSASYYCRTSCAGTKWGEKGNCSDGQFCDNGVCLPDELCLGYWDGTKCVKSCTDTNFNRSGCPDGQFCLSGSCVDIDTECKDKGGHWSGWNCTLYCTYHDLSQGECPEGTFCWKGACKDQSFCRGSSTGLWGSSWDASKNACVDTCPDGWGEPIGSSGFVCIDGYAVHADACASRGGALVGTPPAQYCYQYCSSTPWGETGSCPEGQFCNGGLCNAQSFCSAEDGMWNGSKCVVYCNYTGLGKGQSGEPIWEGVQGNCPDGTFCWEGFCADKSICSSGDIGPVHWDDAKGACVDDTCAGASFGWASGDFFCNGTNFLPKSACSGDFGRWDNATNKCIKYCSQPWGEEGDWQDWLAGNCRENLFCANGECVEISLCESFGGTTSKIGSSGKWKCTVPCTNTDLSKGTCPEGTFCWNSVCTDVSTCKDIGGKWDGEKCQNGCSGAWGTQSSCGSGFFCQDGQCVENSECAYSGGTWESGTCVVRCSDGDLVPGACPDGTFCWQGKCMDKSNCEASWIGTTNATWNDSKKACVAYCSEGWGEPASSAAGSGSRFMCVDGGAMTIDACKQLGGALSKDLTYCYKICYDTWGEVGSCPEGQFCSGGLCRSQNMCRWSGGGWDSSTQTCYIPCQNTDLGQGKCPDGAFCFGGQCRDVDFCDESETGLPSSWDYDINRCMVSCPGIIFGNSCGNSLFCNDGECAPTSECTGNVGQWEESTSLCVKSCHGEWGDHTGCPDGLFCKNFQCRGEQDCVSEGGRWDANKSTCYVQCWDTDYSNRSCPEGTFCKLGKCVTTGQCIGDLGVWDKSNGKCVTSCSGGFGEHSVCPPNYFCDGNKCLHMNECTNKGLVWDKVNETCFEGCSVPFGEQGDCQDGYFCDSGRCTHYSSCTGSSVWNEETNICTMYCTSLWGQQGNCPADMFCNEGICDYMSACNLPEVSWDSSSNTCKSTCGDECTQGTCKENLICHAGACVSPTRKICPDFQSSCGLIEEQSDCLNGEWCTESGCIPECGVHNGQGSCEEGYFCSYAVDCIEGCGADGTQGTCGNTGICHSSSCLQVCDSTTVRGGCADPSQFCQSGKCVDSTCGVVGYLDPSDNSRYCAGSGWKEVDIKGCLGNMIQGINGCYRPDLIGEECGLGSWYSYRGCEDIAACRGHCLTGSSVICYRDTAAGRCRFVDPEDEDTWPDFVSYS